MELNRTFGIELEFNDNALSQREVITRLAAAGVNVNPSVGFQPHLHNNQQWVIKPDGSCGYEIVSRVLNGSEGLAEMRRTIEIMDGIREAAGITVDERCGFHVHISIADLSWKQVRNLVRLVMKYEDTILAFQPERRRGNRFTESIRTDLYKAVAQVKSERKFRTLMGSMSKYYGMNLMRFLTLGTVEFRYGAGTLNPAKVTAWVTFLMGMVEAAKAARSVTLAVPGRKVVHMRSDALYMINGLRQYAGWSEVVDEAKKVLIKRFKKYFRGDVWAVYTWAA